MNETKIIRAHTHVVSGMFVFLLLGVFVVFSTVMVLMSAQLYRATVAQTDQHSEQRVMGNYLMNIARANDRAQSVEIREMEGIEVLCFNLTVDGQRYQTQIYCYDGYLRELFTAMRDHFEPSYGEPICKAQRFSPMRKGGMLEMRTVDDQGREQLLHVALRCGGEESPQ